MRPLLMSFLRLSSIVVVFGFCAPINLRSQVPRLSPPDPLPSPVREAKGIELIEKTITAMGGAAVIGQVQTAIIQGDMTAPPDSPLKNGSFLWKAVGSEYRFEASTSSGIETFVTGHGKPTQTHEGKATELKAHIARAMFVPSLIGPLLLRELQDPNYSIRYNGASNTGGVPVEIATTAAETKYPDNVVTPQVWYVNSSNGLPVRVEFRGPDGPRPGNFDSVAFDFSGFQTISGALYPLHIVYSADGNVLQTYTIKSLQPNGGVSPSDFDSPVGGGQ